MSHSSMLALGALLALHAAGALHVLHALMHVRSAQGAVAWIVALLTVPAVAIPLYWIAGRSRFSGYVHARRADDQRLRQLAEDMQRRLRAHELPPDDGFERSVQVLGGLPLTRGNQLEVLVDGEAIFRSIFRAIAEAQDYLLVCFFIVKNDRVGRRFKQALVERARAGVRVMFLFDEFGSHKLSRGYLRELRAAGVRCHPFGTNRRWWSRLQVNFRNHRKIMIADGRLAFVGGLNVGDEYLGGDQRFGAWRDTHLRIAGPAVQAVQMVFLEDWYWACSEVLQLEWTPHPRETDQPLAVIPTGPADPGHSWQLVVASAANSARRRLWITSPYFVPDNGVLTSLQAAALRGVDVRILLPERPDHLLVWLSSFSYYGQTIPYGIRLLRYQRGFLHQKVLLIDDRFAGIGTANLDNRSFRLNFEITALSGDPGFVDEISHMLEVDFLHAREVAVEEFTGRSFLFRAACQAAHLLAPVQ